MGYRPVIESASVRFQIDKVVLAALLIQEGQGRASARRIPVLGTVVQEVEACCEIAGRNKTVGIAQMRPDVAVDLASRYFDVEMSEGQARGLLARDDEAAIRLAAANLRKLIDTYDLTDEGAYVAYAGTPKAIRAWQSSSGEARADYPLMFAREAGFEQRYTQALELFTGG